MKFTMGPDFINRGSTLLNDLWDTACVIEYMPHCLIEDTVDHVLNYDAKTYKYILLTQLLGKAVDERVNILTFQQSSTLPNAWSARSFCEKVITRSGFERAALKGILGGSKQPYNSGPGQEKELSQNNGTAIEDVPLRDELIDALLTIRTSQEAKDAVLYFLYVCKGIIASLPADEILPTPSEKNISCARTRKFWRDLAHVGIEGEGLSLAIATLLDMALNSPFKTRLHQINTSRRGQGDIDLYCKNKRFLTFEIKDKPFAHHEVIEYASAAFDNGWDRFAFVYGYGAGTQGEVLNEPDYASFAMRGKSLACIPFEALLDTLTLTKEDIPLDDLYDSLLSFIRDARIGAKTATPARQLLRELVIEVNKGANG